MVALILAGVGGFLALLLRGAGLSSTAKNTTTPTTVVSGNNTSNTEPATNTTETPTQVEVTDPPASTQKPTTQEPSTQASPAKTTTTKTVIAQASKTNTDTKNKEAPIEIVVKKTTPAPQPTAQSNQQNTNPVSTIKPTAPKQPIVQPSQTTRPQTTTTTSGSTRADFLRSYRVAVGTYASIGRAGSVAANLRNQGFPARAFVSGNSAVVVVGPYNRETTATRSLNNLHNQFPDAILYRPDGSRSKTSTNRTTPQNNSRTTIAPKQTTTTTQTATPTTTYSKPVYLQVGAFKDLRSAQHLLSDLRDQGYRPTLRSRPDGYTRLLIGPFAGDALQQATTATRAKGLSPFVVSR